MASAPKRPAAPGPREREPGSPRSRKPPKKATNLTLDPAVVASAEQYGARHGRKLSQLVNGFLSALPSSEAADLAELSPAVRRLYGVAAGDADGREAYSGHLARKYGSRDA